MVITRSYSSPYPPALHPKKLYIVKKLQMLFLMDGLFKNQKFILIWIWSSFFIRFNYCLSCQLKLTPAPASQLQTWEKLKIIHKHSLGNLKCLQYFIIGQAWEIEKESGTLMQIPYMESIVAAEAKLYNILCVCLVS